MRQCRKSSIVMPGLMGAYTPHECDRTTRKQHSRLVASPIVSSPRTSADWQRGGELATQLATIFRLASLCLH